jgi:zinc protease
MGNLYVSSPCRNLKENTMHHRTTAALAALLLATLAPAQPPSPPAAVTRASLDNGLKIVIIRDPLAPVATIEVNFMVGADEVPPGLTGLAHAQEHMIFRGCQGLTADQISAIFAQLGGAMNAETQQNLTQYFVTVPSQDLEVALRIYSSCMADVEDSQQQWTEERGAIEQEVARDMSSPLYKLTTRLNHDLFAGTPYETDALGTDEAFNKTTGADLKAFFRKWYAPNNAILVIAGDVDPTATLAKVKELFGGIARRDLPARPAIDLKPVKPESFVLDSNLPYSLQIISFRFPGTSSPDYAAARILADVVSSQRAALYDLVPQGKALATQFGLVASYPMGSAAFALAAIPPNADPAPINAAMKKILDGYAQNGVPADLVDAAKKGEIAGAEFERNSISDLASLWSQALAGEGKNSPEEDLDALKKVTLADVNAAARKYFSEPAIVATLKPVPSGEAVASKGFGGKEATTSTPTKPVALPDWAEAAVKSLRVPEQRLHPSDVTLANGIRLIVETEKTSPTVTLIGSIKTQIEMETPPGKEGVSDILDGLFSYGSKTLDRLAFQKALDDIAASENAGASFNLKVLKADFTRGVELLADNELHPALPEDAFKVVQQQTAEEAGGQLQSPAYRTERSLLSGLLPAKDPLLRETTPQTVSAVSYQDLQSFYAKCYRPDLTTIAIIGDITPEEARAVVEKYFGKWQAAGPKPDVTLPPVPANKPSAMNVPDPSSVQDEVELAQQLEMNRFSHDYYALQLGDHVLGGGFYATRLYRDVRQKAGYVYTIDNSLQAGQTRANYSIDYGCDPKNVSKARAMVEDELRDMQKNNVSPAELQQAKALLLRQIPLGEASEDAVAGGLIGRARIGLPLNEPENAARRYYDMTADEVRQAFAKYINPASFVQVVRGPAPQ